uniref:Uncharacterized protein n=1 Tax=Rhizophora mucronata TaxID=61149 RepID=A0A2P2PEP7_RHIMU
MAMKKKFRDFIGAMNRKKDRNLYLAQITANTKHPMYRQEKERN